MGTASIQRFRRSGQRWWNKPLVVDREETTTAELAVLRQQLREDQGGAWMNSRGTRTGAVALVRDRSRKTGFRTERCALPEAVGLELRELYQAANLKKGCPDLAIWDRDGRLVRLVEVKWRGHDEESEEQRQFMLKADEQDIDCSTVEWVFDDEKGKDVGKSIRGT